MLRLPLFSRSLFLFGALTFLAACKPEEFGVNQKPFIETPLVLKKEEVATSTLMKWDDRALKQFVVPSATWNNLSLRRKMFVYYLSLATQAGQEIGWQQNSRHGAAIRDICAAIWKGREKIFKFEESQGSRDTVKWNNFVSYFVSLLTYSKNYHPSSQRKFVPQGITYEDFGVYLVRSGAIELVPSLAKLRKSIFDPAFEEYYFVPDGTDLDPIADAGSNYYEAGLTYADYQKAAPELQSDPFVYLGKDETGKVVAKERIKVGGRYDAELRRVNTYFEEAKKYAEPQEIDILDALILANITGRKADFDRANRLWVQYHPKDVVFAIGFYEEYGDPLSVRSEWLGWVGLIDQSDVGLKRAQAMIANAQYFEAQMPVNPEFRRAPEDAKIPFNAILYVVNGGGMMGRAPFKGENLPNSEAIKAELGTISVTFLNTVEEMGGASRDLSELNFIHPEYREAMEGFDSQLAALIQVEFHEALGHGSGKTAPGITGADVEKNLGALYLPIEEARAETASLYHMLDFEALLKMEGFYPPGYTSAKAEELARMQVIRFFTRQIREYRSFKESVTNITQPHLRARQVMLNFLRSKGLLNVVLEKGVPVIYLPSSSADLRKALGELWATLQDVRSLADVSLATDLLKKWDAYTDEHREWRAAIDAKSIELGISKFQSYFPATLTVDVDANREPIVSNVHVRHRKSVDQLSTEKGTKLHAGYVDTVAAFIDGELESTTKRHQADCEAFALGLTL